MKMKIAKQTITTKILAHSRNQKPEYLARKGAKTAKERFVISTEGRNLS